MQAAVGVAQLEQAAGVRRGAQAELAATSTTGSPTSRTCSCCPRATEHSEPSWFGFPITVRAEAPFDRHELVRYLEERKIAHPAALRRQPDAPAGLRGLEHRIVGDLTNTDVVMNRTFWIGVYPGLSDEMIGFVVSEFERFFRSSTAGLSSRTSSRRTS